MNILDITRFVRGYVEFEASGSFPERLINLSLRRGINIYDTKGRGGLLVARVPKSHFASLKKLGDRCGVDIKIIKCRGLPFIYQNNKNRWGLALGAVFFLILCQLLSSFVWNIDVEPTPTVSEYKIRQALEHQGLYSGAWKSRITPDTIERETMMELGSFGWMSVNITGINARVSVSEKYKPSDVEGEETKPCNIKAKKDGQVVKMDIKNGSSVAKLGDGVAKGDLLVSGVVSTENGGDFLTPAIGSVYAETKTIKTVSQPLEYTESLPSGGGTQRSMLDFIGIKIPLGLSYVPGGEYSRHIERLRFTSCGNTMPVGIYNEYCTEYQSQRIKLSEDEANKSCLAELALFEAFEMPRCEIKDRKLKSTVKDNAYILTAEYTCVEDIGEVSYIGVEEADEAPDTEQPADG